MPAGEPTLASIPMLTVVWAGDVPDTTAINFFAVMAVGVRGLAGVEPQHP